MAKRASISIRIRLLGGFELTDADGNDCAPPGKKLRALIACMALPPGEAWPRERLTAVLWGDRDEEQARNSLRQALAKLRRDLGSAVLSRTDRDTVGFDRGLVWVDAADFERSTEADDIEQAVELYRGELLDGFQPSDSGFADWLLVERTRLHDIAVGVMSRLLDSQDGDAAIRTARRLLQLEPTRETTHRALMRLYALRGQRAQSLRQYQTCRDCLQRDLGIRPEPETERLFHELRASPGVAIVETAPPSASTKPWIAVHTFTNMSGDLDQQYFSAGMTEDIITELSRSHALFDIARIPASATDTSVRIQDVARERRFDYVVQGSVRRAANQVRITAQLVDARSGKHLWAEHYDGDLHDIFALQDEVARSIASTIIGRVDSAGRHRAVRLSRDALQAYDLVLRAKALTAKYKSADNAQALACAERAMELDPTSARAHAHAAWCHFFDYMACWTGDRAGALVKAYALALRAVLLDDTDSFARCILGAMHLFRREYDEAQSEIQTAIALNPNDPEARRYYGNLLATTGRADAAIEQIDLAKRLNPFDTHWVPWIRGIACFTARRYGEAIATLRQARDPINEVRGWLAASYAHAGRLPEAKAALEEFMRAAQLDMADFPGLRLKDWEPYWHGAFEYRDQKDFDHLFDGLRIAGLSR